jgi:hypothetical protein
MTFDFDVDRLREGVAELDDAHHSAMATLDDDIRELHAETRKAVGGASRRDFLIKSALATTALTIGSSVIPVRSFFSASALAAGLTDADIAAFAATVEYTAVAAYGAAAKSGKVKTPAIGAAATLFAGHHKQHGDAFQGASGGKVAKDQTNKQLLTELSTQLGQAADEMAVVKLAYGVENAAAATYLFALGALQDAGAQKLSATILPVEAGHAAVLGNVLYGADPSKDKDWLPAFQNDNLKLDPTKYPVS